MPCEQLHQCVMWLLLSTCTPRCYCLKQGQQSASELDCKYVFACSWLWIVWPRPRFRVWDKNGPFKLVVITPHYIMSCTAAPPWMFESVWGMLVHSQACFLTLPGEVCVSGCCKSKPRMNCRRLACLHNTEFWSEMYIFMVFTLSLQRRDSIILIRSTKHWAI